MFLTQIFLPVTDYKGSPITETCWAGKKDENFHIYFSYRIIHISINLFFAKLCNKTKWSFNQRKEDVCPYQDNFACHLASCYFSNCELRVIRQRTRCDIAHTSVLAHGRNEIKSISWWSSSFHAAMLVPNCLKRVT